MESVIIYHNNLYSQCNFTAKAERLQDREHSPVTKLETYLKVPLKYILRS
jgi:hypothetical protein